MRIALPPEPQKKIIPEGELLRLNEWAQAAGWALAVAVGALGLMLITTKGSPSQHLNGSLRPIVGLVWVAFGLMIAGEARSGVIVDESGIRVQGWLRCRRWNWAEIQEFKLKRPFFRQSLRVILVDGRTVSAPGFAPRTSAEQTLVNERIAELNRRLQSK